MEAELMKIVKKKITVKSAGTWNTMFLARTSKYSEATLLHTVKGFNQLMMVWDQLIKEQQGNILNFRKSEWPPVMSGADNREMEDAGSAGRDSDHHWILKFSARYYIDTDDGSLWLHLTNDERRRVLVELCEKLCISRDCSLSTKKKS